MKPILLGELASPGRRICKRLEEFWHSIEKQWLNVAYKKLGVLTPEGQALAQKYTIFASPGIILNGALFSTGGFDPKKFTEKLHELSRE